MQEALRKANERRHRDLAKKNRVRKEKMPVQSGRKLVCRSMKKENCGAVGKLSRIHMDQSQMKMMKRIATTQPPLCRSQKGINKDVGSKCRYSSLMMKVMVKVKVEYVHVDQQELLINGHVH